MLRFNRRKPRKPHMHKCACADGVQKYLDCGIDLIITFPLRCAEGSLPRSLAGCKHLNHLPSNSAPQQLGVLESVR